MLSENTIPVNLPASNDRYPAITVSRNAQFFVALCRFGGIPHHYIMAGCLDGEGKSHILNVVGKNDPALDDAKGHYLTNERVIYSHQIQHSHKIYRVPSKAYAISFEQYMALISLQAKIALFQTEKFEKIDGSKMGLYPHFYFPSQSDDGKLIFQYTDDFEQDDFKNIFKHYAKQCALVEKNFKVLRSFVLIDNCRKGARFLLKAIGVEDNKVGNNFFNQLPQTMFIQSGKLISPMVLYPSVRKSVINNVDSVEFAMKVELSTFQRHIPRIKDEMSRQCATTLFDCLHEEVAKYFIQKDYSEKTTQAFVDSCRNKIIEANETLKHHRTPGWQRFMLKFLSALAIIASGIVPGLIFKAVYSYKTTNKVTFFRDITRSEGHLNQLQKGLDKILLLRA